MRYSRRAVFSAVIPLSICIAVGEGTAETLEYIAGARYGSGFDSRLGIVKGNCIKFDSNEIGTTGFKGLPSEPRKKHIESTDDLRRLINVSAEASFRGLFYSVEGKSDWLRSKRVNRYSVDLIVYDKVRHPDKVLLNPALTTEAARLRESNPSAFRDMCGDRYVAGMIGGGEFFAHLKLATYNSQEESAFKSNLDVNVATFDGSIDINRQVEQLVSERKEELEIYMLGGDSETVTPTTLSEIIEYWKGFRSEVSDELTAVPIAMIVS